MAHASRFARCTAQNEDESFCDGPTTPDAPFPICVRHLGQIATYLLSVAPDVMQALELSAETFDPAESNRRNTPHVPTIYYLRVNDSIKIGYTTNLHQRLRSYPPFAVVLATEPGRRALEASRHRQFAGSRTHGREWFQPTAELIAHINSLRKQPLTAADLAA